MKLPGVSNRLPYGEWQGVTMLELKSRPGESAISAYKDYVWITLAGWLMWIGAVLVAWRLVAGSGSLKSLFESQFGLYMLGLYALLGNLVVPRVVTFLINRAAVMRLGRPVMRASSDRLRPGEILDLAFALRVRWDTAISHMIIGLVRREVAILTSPSPPNIPFVHEDVADKVDWPGRRLRRGDVIDERLSFKVPADMHSFRTKRNVIEWLVIVKIGIPKWPDLTAVYEVTVLPEVASA